MIGYNMEILYATSKIEELCTDEKKCKRMWPDIAKGIKLRHIALEIARSLDDITS